ANRRTVLSTAKLLGLVSPDAALAESTMGTLKYSRNEIRLVGTLLQAHRALMQNFEAIARSKTEQYHLFKQVGPYFPALVLLALTTGFSLEQQRTLIETFLDPHSPIAHPKAILSGTELIQTLDLESGPQIGALLHQIAIAQAEGLVITPKDAIAFIKNRLERE
ncbi:MAG: CCA tRNA nucleotidyltransferase, partial [Cyanobacteria bacterium P01_F01_bin.42]